MIYPGALDYDSAVKAPDKFLLDPLLRRSRPVMRDGSSVEPLQFSGGYARVYQFQDQRGVLYAFRCWIKDIGDERLIYWGIGEYLKKLKAPFFVDFNFLREAILVNGRKYPGLRMNWIDAPSLQQFAYNHRSNVGVLQACAEAFLNVAKYLHSVHVAHGDLQGDNIKVLVNGGPVQIRLIDYDTMYVPTAGGRPLTIRGLDSYQHPRRGLSGKTTEKDDYFSELVIYLGLIALAKCEIIRRDFKPPDKDLLFSAQDFRDPTASPLFKKFRQAADPEVRALGQALAEACKKPGIEYLRPLEAVVESVQGPSFPPRPPESIFGDEPHSVPPEPFPHPIQAEESIFENAGQRSAAPTATSPRILVPQQGAAPAATPAAGALEGVRGWLLLFVLSLMIFQPILIVWWLASLDFSAIVRVLGIVQAGFSFYSGYALCKKRRWRSVRLAKVSLFLAFLAAFILADKQGALAGWNFWYALFGWQYLSDSERVRATYG